MKYILFTLFISISIAGTAQEKPEGLFINSKAPDFKANDQNGNEISLKDMRKKGNVVIVFYRGNWSPYCNRYLKKLQDSLQYIMAKKAMVVAITPEGPVGIDSTLKKTGGLAFPVIFDKDMKISDSYRVSFPIDNRTVARYKNAGIDLLKTNEQKEAYLPVPAVYVVNSEGSITYRYFNEDYKQRAPLKDIIKMLY